MMSISIIIPVYNVAPYIRRCLESVMSQDAVEADVECILVDDCGQDDSMEIARKVIADYQGSVRFVVVAHDRNRGLSAVRNTGLEHATGDYVLFVDSDDHLRPKSLKYMCDQLKQYPEADIVQGNVLQHHNNCVMIHGISEPWLITNPDVFFTKVLRQQIYLYAWNKLIRRSLLMDNHIRFIEGIIYEDQAWSYQLYGCCSSVLLLPEITYDYEDIPQSIIHTAYSSGKAEQTLYSFVASARLMMDNPPDSHLYQRNMAVDYLLFMIHVLMNGADVLLQAPVSNAVANEYRKVRRQLLMRSLRWGRLLVACFCLLLYNPFTRLQRWHFFRSYYYTFESIVNRIAHLTDFLHNRHRL